MAKRIYYLLLIIGLALITGGCATNEPPMIDSLRYIQSHVSFDLDNDGIDESGRSHAIKGRAYVYKDEEIIFGSDPDWYVWEIIAGDFNNDGQADFGLSLWKRGNYGPSTPFWVEENDNSYKMHLFLFTWKNEKIKALWHSSNLPKINVRTRLMDIDNNGKNELVVLERDYESNNYSIALWRWNGWGFELENRKALPFHQNFS